MTVNLEKFMGKKATFKIQIRGINNRFAFRVPVLIKWAKNVCGSVNLKVKPIGGTGSAWVRRSAVRISARREAAPSGVGEAESRV